jgi:hypothetical protein
LGSLHLLAVFYHTQLLGESFHLTAFILVAQLDRLWKSFLVEGESWRLNQLFRELLVLLLELFGSCLRALSLEFPELFLIDLAATVGTAGLH